MGASVSKPKRAAKGGPSVMIEFTDILLTTTLPVHPLLAADPRLSVSLIEDEKVHAETPVINGDFATGIWEINSGLSANSVKQSVTLAVFASREGLQIRLVSVKLGVSELLAGSKARLDGYQEFNMQDPDSSMQLIMTCTVKVSPSLTVNSSPSHSGIHDTSRRTENTQSDHEPNSTDREELESLYGRIARTPRGVKKAVGLSMLGRAYHALYQEEGDEADLEKAISLHEDALQCTGTFHPQLADGAHELSSTLARRFEQRGDMVDIERAVSYLQKALNVTEDGNIEKPGRLNNLGVAFRLRFERLGHISDVQNAILSLQKAVGMTAGSDPDKPGRLANLGAAFQSRFERLGSLQDLEDALSNKREAVKLMSDGHPGKPDSLNNLGNALRLRFQRVGGLQDLEDALSNQRRALELTPDGDPAKPGRLHGLGIALQTRFDHLGGLEDLENGISTMLEAVELMPDGHSNKPDLLNSLGDALRLRFQRLGDLQDSEDAISHQRKALELTPDGDPDRPGRLNNLGITLQTRFERLGSLEDLEGAISTMREAVGLMPDSLPSKPDLLSNLGVTLQTRFERLGGLEDLEGAISTKRTAVELIPDGHPDKPTWLTNLGNALGTRFERLDNLNDLEEALSNHRRAVKLTPDGHPNKPAFLNNLGTSLHSNFERLGSFEDLDGAISSSRRAVELTPDSHPDKSRWLFNLGCSFIVRWSRSYLPSDSESALSSFSSAANSSTSSAMNRFKAARAWAEHSETTGRSPLEAFSCAIDLLPRIAWLGLAVTDQHALLADVGGIVRNAVAVAIRYEDYETAVVWAEQGRSIVWQNLLGLRTPVDKLRQAHPEMANQLYYIARQLEGSGSQDVDLAEIPTTLASASYSKLAIEWDAIIERIRKISGFEGFLRAKSFRELAPAAHEGPVVILNINDSRCDALVLIPEYFNKRSVSAINIPLERFSHEKAKKLFHNLTELLSSAGVRERNDRKTRIVGSGLGSDAKFQVILSILWNDVVKPVIEGLAFEIESERPPRIWWCATGLLSFLPIHAAGLYDTQEIGEKVSDFVISSYAPTLNSILELSEPVVRDDFQVLTVAQASAPGANPIPKTEDEVKIVQELTASARALNLKRDDATVQRVRDGMMESNWIHLACHGQQDLDDPMGSGFLLHDDKLKLSEIVKMSLPKAEFAFLSACQTAMGDEKVAEESVHLAAGMLLSGCRGIIATTWSIRDDDAPKIAQEVYSRMFKDGKPTRNEAAYALHEAVKLLRESGADCVSWVPFIHIGR